MNDARILALSHVRDVDGSQLKAHVLATVSLEPGSRIAVTMPLELLQSTSSTNNKARTSHASALQGSIAIVAATILRRLSISGMACFMEMCRISGRNKDKAAVAVYDDLRVSLPPNCLSSTFLDC